MPDAKGRIQKGERLSPKTEFQLGQHWRKPQLWWDRDWLWAEYGKKSAAEIAKEHGCGEQNILYWLSKHGIQRRTVAEARKRKHWGLSGSQNGMFGRTESANPNWKRGITPDRQAFYASLEWAKTVKLVWRRDKALCQHCRKRFRNKGPTFHIHHKVSFEELALRVEANNLILLCKPCHSWIHSKKNIARTFIGSCQLGMEGGDIASGEP